MNILGFSILVYTVHHHYIGEMMRQFESMLRLYHVLPRRSWTTLQSLHGQCVLIGIMCSNHTLRRWLKAWVTAGFVEERKGEKQYLYRQSSHQPFVTYHQDALLYWLSRYFYPLLPDGTCLQLATRLEDNQTRLLSSASWKNYLGHIEIELPILPKRYLTMLSPIKKAMLNQREIDCVFIGQSLRLMPQAVVLNSQGWWLRYQINKSALKETDSALSVMRLVVCLLWVDEY